MNEPLFWAKSIVVVGEDDSDINRYIIGNGLEIIPQKRIHLIKEGGKISLMLLYDGERVASTINSISEKGKSILIKTTKNIVINVIKNG